VKRGSLVKWNSIYPEVVGLESSVGIVVEYLNNNVIVILTCGKRVIDSKRNFVLLKELR
jgi:hypothetical protein